MKGYYGREDLTMEVIEPDGWLHTGDSAKVNEILAALRKAGVLS